MAAAVRGMSCMSPMAPALETTSWLKSLSTRITARMNGSGSW